MAVSPTARIHPTAVVSPEANLADGVEVGPFVVLEGPVTIGEGSVIRPHAHLVGPLMMGRNNKVYTGEVLGEQPQHLKYAGEPSRIEIGDDNTFREHVTVHRAATAGGQTVIGRGNFFMAGSHVAHDCVIGNQCILANGALVGGHAVVEDHVFLSGNSAVHQFCRVGRLALLSGVSATSKDIPPFMIQQDINILVGVNVIGMRRNGYSGEQVDGVRRAYHILFREGQLLPNAIARIEQDMGDLIAVQELLRFIRGSSRGISAAA